MKKMLGWSAVGLGLSAYCAGAAAAETLTVSNGLPPTHVVSMHGFDPWMACVEEATGGEVDFNYFPSGQIATVGESLNALETGLADVAFTSSTNEGSKLPLSNMANLPGMGQTSSEMSAAYRAVVEKGGAVSGELANNHVRAMVVNVLPAYQIMSGNEPIDSLDAFGGRTVRVAGGAMTFTVSALGASPVDMPAADVYMSLQRGTVDSTILALSSVKSYSLQELIKAMSTNGSFGSSGQFFAISDAAWERLSPEQQGALADCGRKVEADLATHIDSQDELLREEFASLGITLYEFSPEESAAIAERLDQVAEDYVSRLADRGLPAQEAFDEFKAAAGE